MSTNYVAAYGPSGPLYLLKTATPNQWWVINGNWLLDIETINNQLNSYVIIEDNFTIQSYQQACDFINYLYGKNLPYKKLRTNNLSYFDPGQNNKEQEKAQKFYDAFLSKSSEKEQTSTIEDNPKQKVKDLCERFNINASKLELRVYKKMIERKYKLSENKNMSTLNTDIVTTKTIHTVNGQEVEFLSDNDLLNYIAQLETSIKKLIDIRAESVFVKNTIEKQRNTLDVVIKHLDDRSS